LSADSTKKPQHYSELKSGRSSASAANARMLCLASTPSCLLLYDLLFCFFFSVVTGLTDSGPTNVNVIVLALASPLPARSQSDVLRTVPSWPSPQWSWSISALSAAFALGTLRPTTVRSVLLFLLPLSVVIFLPCLVFSSGRYSKQSHYEVL
jgi:hypothetical protein